MWPQGNRLIIELRPLLPVWTARRSLKRVQSIQRGMKRALPGFRLSSLSRRRQWTEHATRWAWPRSPSPSAHQSTLPGRSGLLARWRSCTFLWNRPPEGQEGEEGKKKKLWLQKNESCLSSDEDWTRSIHRPFLDASQEKLQIDVQTLLHSHNLTLVLLTQVWCCWSHTSSTPLMRTDSRGEEGAHRYQTTPTKPQKPSTSVGSDPAFLSRSEQEMESVHWKLFWHFPPLLLPLSSWVRLPRELLWWLIDFNHITRLQKSRQRMKVLGNTTPWNPHTNLNIYARSDAYDTMLLRGHCWLLWNCMCVLL